MDHPTERADRAPQDIEVSIRGPVGGDLAAYARSRLQPILERVGAPVHRAHLHVDVATAPIRHRATDAHLEVTLDHDVVHAHGSGPDPASAVDDVHDHLSRQVEELRTRRAALRRRGPSSPPGRWRHGDAPRTRRT